MRLRIVFTTTLLVSSLIIGDMAAFAEASPIKIGATLALTGKLGFVGQAQLRGLEMGIEHVNGMGGIQGSNLTLTYEDNAGDPKMAVSGVNKLLNIDSIDIMFAGMTHITQAIKDIVQHKKRILVYAASIGSIAKENSLSFRDWGDASANGIMLANAIHQAGKKKLAFIAEANDACTEVQAAFRQATGKLNITILDEVTFNPGENDFSSTLIRLAHKKPDALVLCAFRDGGRILTQWKQLGYINIQTFHTLAPFLPVNDSTEMRTIYEENRSVSSWIGFIADDLEKHQTDFFYRYKARYGEAPRVEAALAYDDVLALSNAAQDCKVKSHFDLTCIARNLQDKTNIKGVAGALSFDQNRFASRPDFLIKVVNGKWIREVP